jgi:hypothetical protein
MPAKVIIGLTGIAVAVLAIAATLMFMELSRINDNLAASANQMIRVGNTLDSLQRAVSKPVSPDDLVRDLATIESDLSHIASCQESIVRGYGSC